jgi:uncharacterized protein
LITLDADSRDGVQQIISKAKTLEATIDGEPQDHAWMYQHGFADLDRHQWELIYMDASEPPAQ